MKKLKLTEQRGISHFDIQKLMDNLGCSLWEPSRESVANELHRMFPDSLVTIGGHHVAVHNPFTGDRMLLIEGDYIDFKII